MSNPFVGEIRMFAGNFAPSGWAFCNGQLLAITSNAALFSILGTTYGGNGTTDFALPNLQGSVPLHFGNGISLGQTGGAQNVTLNQSQLPGHSHTLQASTEPAVTDVPTNGVLAAGLAYTPSATNTSLAVGSVGTTGSGLPVPTMPPYQAVSFIISLFGIFPSRN